MISGDYPKIFRKEHYVNKLNLNETEAKELSFFYVACIFNTVKNIASHLLAIIHF